MSDISPEILAKYEPVIGLELHAQLLTDTKAFCSCKASYSDIPNATVCPICLGHPGTLPVVNKKHVEMAVLLGLATQCSIRPISAFARKNYFYPDLSKGYQITQFNDPICYQGTITIEMEESMKSIGITRIHLEEDAGKSLHDIDIDTLIDFNRAGMPLLEIVSEPDMRSAAEAYRYMVTMRQLVRYLGICDGNLEEGSLRCDANVSVRLKGSPTFGTKTEIKNLNSFRNVEKAIAFEIERHIALIESGGEVRQVTMQWDAASHSTKEMRSKEQAHDYRYFQEPDLGYVRVNEELITQQQEHLPELPLAMKLRLKDQYGIPGYDAGILTEDKDLALFFEHTCSKLTIQSKERYKFVSNWILTEILKILSDRKIGIAQASMIAPEAIAEIVDLFADEKISSKIAKEVFAEYISSGISPKEYVAQHGLMQISDHTEVERIVLLSLEGEEENIEKYRSGKNNLMGYFISKVMKASGGKANPRMVNELLTQHLQ
ncbi:Asp-tRNA(Asn)/Glu-tRNA(Gln) amidotransferase subunit GatB [bacterium]|nr:Asp-tRNA(Asn)/Glu-tRNA(Gln) amidotransferase subunit GatB [bacterium]